jgi:transposase-like protein
MKQIKLEKITDFEQRFNNESDCYEYLMEIKWGKGYRCLKCGHSVAVKGKKWYFKRCQKCQYDESVTANTAFHKLKFSILTAFKIMVELSFRKKGVSAREISRLYGINYDTAWLFKSKVMGQMHAKEKLDGLVHLDEFEIGGKTEGKPGRSHSGKRKVMIALEIRKGKKRKNSRKPKATAGNIRLHQIYDYTQKTFEDFFSGTIQKQAEIETDQFTSYKSLKQNWDISQYKSTGKSFPLIHANIMNIKSWIRGIHHKISSKHAQRYLNEFSFRFNRKMNLNSSFHSLLNCMISGQGETRKMICELNG